MAAQGNGMSLDESIAEGLSKDKFSKFQLGDKIGSGAFGKVYKALDVTTGQIVAIKMIEKDLLSQEHIPGIIRELQLLQTLDHPNIVKFIGYHQQKEHLYFLMEYVESGSLYSTMKKFGVFPESLLVIYLQQMLQGLRYLHNKGVIHRDIKGSNVLLTKDGKVKLADFGSGTYAATTKTITCVGTPFWMAPEIISLSGGHMASDIWSLGCVIIELLTGNPPYYDDGAMAALFRMVEDDHPPFPAGISDNLRDFLEQCFIKDPKTRPSAEMLLLHPWITQGAKSTVKPQGVEDLYSTLSHFNTTSGGSTRALRQSVAGLDWSIIDSTFSSLSGSGSSLSSSNSLSSIPEDKKSDDDGMKTVMYVRPEAKTQSDEDGVPTVVIPAGLIAAAGTGSRRSGGSVSSVTTSGRNSSGTRGRTGGPALIIGTPPSGPKAVHDTAATQELQLKVDALTAENNDLKAKFDHANEEAAGMRTKISEQGTENDLLKSQNLELMSEKRNMMNQLSEFKELLITLTAQKNALNEQLTSLRNSLSQNYTAPKPMQSPETATAGAGAAPAAGGSIKQARTSSGGGSPKAADREPLLPVTDKVHTCHACNTVITGVGRMALGKTWHAKCFACHNCKTVFSNSAAFVQRDGEPYCVACYQKLFSAKCLGCNLLITGPYIRAIDGEWHTECFTCTDCKSVLTSGYYVKNRKPQCPNCHAK